LQGLEVLSAICQKSLSILKLSTSFFIFEKCLGPLLKKVIGIQQSSLFINIIFKKIPVPFHALGITFSNTILVSN